MKANMTIALLIILGVAGFANAQTMEKKVLTIEGARKVIAGAVAYAKKNNAPGGVIAVVDDGGNLMALERLDGTFAAGANVSIGKARTAALFKKPTKVFEDTIKNGRTALIALPDAYFTPLQGGVPITIDGQIVGAVGVSGAASAQQDEEIALAGASVLMVTKLSSTSADIPTGKPDATIDLGSAEGLRSVKGVWRYSDTKIVDAVFRSAGPDKQPTGAPVKTYDYTPHGGGADFDDSKWEVIGPTTLDQRRGHGRLGFNWYRIKLTIPDRIGDFDPTGATAVFETSLDDYAEIWVDGELSRALGQSGGSVIAGWNAENHLVVGRNVKPGQQIQLAIFGVNGPLSNPPTNFIYLRYARLSFYKTVSGPVALAPSEVNVEVVRKDPRMDEVVGPNPKVFKLADGFKFTEGPVWINKDGGYLLFSDPNANTIYRYTPNGNQDGKLEVFRTPSGYSGADIAEYGQPGSNGLTIDPQGRLTINQHGNHRVVRDEVDGTQTVLADSYDGKRLNSPNDLVYRSDGTLFFTDPPFGFPKLFNDERKQLPFSGVYSIYKGQLQLINKDFTGPNGIALSPDEKYLYVGNWPRSLTGQELRKQDEAVTDIGDKHKAIMRYEVQPDGTLKNGKLFFDFTSAPGEDGLDGIKVDQSGNLYVSGPGGLWVISADGKHLGTIITPRHVHNMAWGDADGKTLYLCARSGLYRIRLNIGGAQSRNN
jgi:gluconolactonase